MVRLKETFGGNETYCDAGLLSDGTLRVLALAAALLSSKEGSLVIVEEIDNGLHPSRASRIFDLVNQLAQQRKLTILISTHNPSLLDALPDETVQDVIFCYREMETGLNLGHLLTKGLIDRFVKFSPTKEEKKQKALAWLNNLKSGTKV